MWNLLILSLSDKYVYVILDRLFRGPNAIQIPLQIIGGMPPAPPTCSYAYVLENNKYATYSKVNEASHIF